MQITNKSIMNQNINDPAELKAIYEKTERLKVRRKQIQPHIERKVKLTKLRLACIYVKILC